MALLFGILTGALVATLELIKSDLTLSNSCQMFSLTALMRRERMVLRSAGMTLLGVVMSSGGSIMDTHLGGGEGVYACLSPCFFLRGSNGRVECSPEP